MTKHDIKSLTELLDRAVAAGVVVKGGGGWISFGEGLAAMRLSQGVEKSVAFLAENAEIVAAIEAALAVKQQSSKQFSPDVPRSEVQDAEPAKPNLAGSAVVLPHGDEVNTMVRSAGVVEYVTLVFPLPPGLPDDALNAALIVVTAKPAGGRWRIGRKFTREETVLPYLELDAAAQIVPLIEDRELIVSLRVPKPG